MSRRRDEWPVSREGEPKRMPAVGRICGQDRGPSWCEVAVFSRGLCRRHYRQLSRRATPDADDMPVVGVTPSGHGVWGELTVDDGRLVCHECGGRYVALGVHVGMVHDGGRAYRLAHGLTMSTPLAVPELSERLADAATRNGGSARIRQVSRRAEVLPTPGDPMVARGARLRH